MISNRLRDRSPIFVVAPRRCFPPVACCRGTRPSQAAKSRALRNVSGGGARTAMAVAIKAGSVNTEPAIALSRQGSNAFAGTSRFHANSSRSSGPIPGTVISRRANSFSFARRAIPASSLPISVSRWVSAATRTLSVPRASAGRPRAGSSTMAISFEAFRPLPDDLPELCQMATQGIDRLRPLPDQQIAHPEDHRRPLGRFALHGNEAHRRALPSAPSNDPPDCLIAAQPT